jgi:hypothetical protein
MEAIRRLDQSTGHKARIGRYAAEKQSQRADLLQRASLPPATWSNGSSIRSTMSADRDTLRQARRELSDLRPTRINTAVTTRQ